MPTITKQKSDTRYAESYYAKNGYSGYSYSTGKSSDIIKYEAGPRRIRGVNNWKRCVHESQTAMSGLLYMAHTTEPWFGETTFGSVAGYTPYTSSSRASMPDLSDLWDAFYDQIDLNCSDGVLLYSGILQAVPLVGGALKGVSILNRAARSLTKSFRRKPFTTVVKSLIQADFIDRFVISPTLDDMRKFADASDYVIRTIRTARSRNAELATAFEQELTNVREHSVTTSDFSDQGFLWQTQATTDISASAKLKVLAKVVYDQDAIDPIKLWAARTGLSRPLDSAWDLVPFSFVIDYFTRAGEFISEVGDRIANQTALKGRVARVFDAWLMTTSRAIRTVKLVGVRKDTPRPITMLGYSHSPVTSGYTRFTRSPVELMRERDFWDREGFVSPRLSSIRARTLAELFIQSKL